MPDPSHRPHPQHATRISPDQLAAVGRLQAYWLGRMHAASQAPNASAASNGVQPETKPRQRSIARRAQTPAGES